ncbi:MAG: EAL domain-containing protein [Methyloprofundus sp.]|nr:EAL domain-containing protein [Methyloprofundus sp.]
MQVDYQLSFVIISIAIAIFSACISLFILDGVSTTSMRIKQLRVISAGLVFATGTWSMHFVGMLAVQLPMPLAYSPSLTFASYLFSVIGSIAAMALISVKNKTLAYQLSASVLLTVAISVMHYTGMASMRMQPAIRYEMPWVFLSVFIAFIAAYIGLYVVNIWERNTKKQRWVFYSAGLVFGVAVSAMHYTGMEAANFSAHSVSFALTDSSTMGEDDLVYAVVSLSCLVMLLLLFSSLSGGKFILHKIFLIIGIAELTVMLVLPVLVPEGSSKLIVAFLDVCLLLLFVFPIAWRVRVNSLDLLDNKALIERNFEAQEATNHLLSLPLHQLSMGEFLNKALRIIQEVPWLRTLPQGAIFLNDMGANSLTMVAEYNLAPQISQRCAKVKHGECLCGVAAATQSIQYHNHLDDAHTVHFDGMKDHGHYNMPLVYEDILHGVLCLYLTPGQIINENEVRILDSFAVTIAELIGHKKALENNQLAQTVFEHNLTCLIITDAEQKILNVNPGFSKVTGYTEEEALGNTLAILKSGKHDGEFYKAMWQGLIEEDSWEGEIWNKRKNGEMYPQWTRISVVRDSQGSIKNYIASFDDISQRKKAEEYINQLAYYDHLTGLPNRSLFYERLDHAIDEAQQDNSKLALLFIDLDRFKEVNDTLGHDAGDSLLKEVAERTFSCLRASDTLARLGGDEFVVIVAGMEGGIEQVKSVIQRISMQILQQLREPYEYQGQVIHSGGSIGVVVFPDHADNRQALIQQADMAMYEAKAAGRNTFRFFSQDMMDRVNRRSQISMRLRDVLKAESDELSLLYQPLIDVQTREAIGVETLLRWHSQTLGDVPILELISLAEEMGLIEAIGEWVLEQACLQFKQWEEGGIVDLEYISVNISIHQLFNANFAQRAKEICLNASIATKRIEFEVTESGLAQYPECITVLHELSAYGFKLAIDDFGTDSSSLSGLKAFNIDTLKIDRSLVSQVTVSQDGAAIVQAIISLGSALGLNSIAEGVETLEQFELLKSYGCTRCQGYYFGKPVSAEEIVAVYLL